MSERREGATRRLTDPTEWVDRHGDALYRYARARLSDQHAAEDLVQETFIAALRSGEFAGVSDERTWFIGILKRKLADHFRRQHREPPLDARHPDEAAEDPFHEKGWWRVPPAKWPFDTTNTLETSEFWDKFRECLASLPQRWRTVFHLREIDGQTTDDVCVALHINPGNLGVLLYRARMAMRRCLELHWFGSDAGGV